MEVPGPDHPITIEPSAQRVVVRFGGQVVADTRRALTLREASLPPVLYIPREDADASLLRRTDHHAYCPYKGDAGYFSIALPNGRIAENAIWTYEQPYSAVSPIAGHLAFYPNRVDAIEQHDA